MLVELPFSSFTVEGTVRLSKASQFSMTFREKRIKITSQLLIMFLRFKEHQQKSSTRGLSGVKRPKLVTGDRTLERVLSVQQLLVQLADL